MDKEEMRKAIQAAPLESYSPEDQAFYRFWYGHMQNDLMQPPLTNIDHASARYIWQAAMTHSCEALRNELHRDIMNLPCKYEAAWGSPSPSDWVEGYVNGHRDTRHAAAELALSALSRHGG